MPPAVAGRPRPLPPAQPTEAWCVPTPLPPPFGPACTRPSNARPPPQPVPRITAKTMRAPAAAPSVASETARQFASLASRTSRPMATLRSFSNARPLSQVELAFLITPVAARTLPGIPTPHRSHTAELAFQMPDQVYDSGDGSVVIAPRRIHAPPRQLRSGVVHRQRLDLRSAQVDPDPHPVPQPSFIGPAPSAILQHEHGRLDACRLPIAVRQTLRKRLCLRCFDQRHRAPAKASARQPRTQASLERHCQPQPASRSDRNSPQNRRGS